MSAVTANTTNLVMSSSGAGSVSAAGSVHDVLIVGAGLTGFALAHTIFQQTGKTSGGPSVLMLEARNRIGGRISTIETPKHKNPVEAGATWVFPGFNVLFKLSQSIGVELMPQYGADGQYRIKGGTSALMTALRSSLPEGKNFNIRLNTPVVSIVRRKEQGFTEVTVEGGAIFRAKKVVTTLPPQLLVHTVRFEPALPPEFMEVARETGTWMGDSMKGMVTYEKPFWRKRGSSGTLYSYEGPFIQLLDQTSTDQKKFALVGFMNPDGFGSQQNGHMNSVDGPASGPAYMQRKSAVIAQLVDEFGPEAANPLEYVDCYWRQERYTMTPHDIKERNEDAWGVPPTRRFSGRQRNFGHSTYRRTDLHDGALFVAGTETSPSAAGFMEGAVISGLTAAKALGFV